MPKPSFEEYKSGHAVELGFNDPRAYEFNLRAAKLSLVEGGFVTRLIAVLNGIREKYGHSMELLFFPPELREIIWHVKTYDSVVDKSYRINVIRNRNYPDEPEDGWINSNNIYSRLNDLIRTRIVCKYMDGPKFIDGHLRIFSKSEGIDYRSEPKGTAAGYYAWHFYFRLNLAAMIEGNIVDTPFWIELQITTQLADVMYILTHELYEKGRILQENSDLSWNWDPYAAEFRSTYLGHGLHLLEGVIQALKDEIMPRSSTSLVKNDSDADSVEK